MTITPIQPGEIPNPPQDQTPLDAAVAAALHDYQMQAMMTNGARSSYQNSFENCVEYPLDYMLIRYNDSFVPAAAQYKTALTTMLEKSRDYVNALTVSELNKEGLSLEEINSFIATLSTSPSGGLKITDLLPLFPGATQEEIDSLSSKYDPNNQVRLDLLEAMNDYRDLEWSIALKRNEYITKQIDADLLYIPARVANNPYMYNYAPYVNAQNAAYDVVPEINDLILQRQAKLQAITTAENAYKQAYGDSTNPADNVLLTIFNRVKEYVANWSSSVEATQLPALEALHTRALAYSQEIQGIQVQYFQAVPTFNPAFVSELLSQDTEAIKTTISNLQTALEGINVNIGTIQIPILPQPSQQLSMDTVMKKLIMVQLMLHNLDIMMKMADNDTMMNIMSSALGQVDQTRESVAKTAWANIIYDADHAFNQTIEEHNTQEYANNYATLNTYLSHTDVINNVIQQVNDRITEANNQITTLTTALNTISGDVATAINNAFQGSVDINWLDFGIGVPTTTATIHFFPDQLTPPPEEHLTEGPITSEETPPTAPHGEDFPNATYTPVTPPETAYTADTIPLFPSFTTPSSSQVPTAYPSDKLGYYNFTVDDITKQIAPFKTEVLQALSEATGMSIDQLQLTYFYPASTIPVRDYRLSFIGGSFGSLLLGFSQMINKLDHGDSITQNSKLSRLTYDQLISTLRSHVTEESPTKSLGGTTGFTLVDLAAEEQTVAAWVANATGSETFQITMQQLLMRHSLLAGIATLGMVPSVMKMPSIMGIPMAEILQDLNISPDQLYSEAEMNLFLAGFVDQLLMAAANTSTLRSNALQVVTNLKGVDKLSKEDLQQLIATLIAIQQMLIAMLAALLGVAGGVPVQDIQNAALGKDETTIARFQAIGIPEEQANKLSQVIRGTAPGLFKVFGEMGFDQTTSDILLGLIAAYQGNISLAEGPFGSYLLQAMLNKLASANFPLEQAKKEEFLNKLYEKLSINASESVKAELRRLLFKESVSDLPPLTDETASTYSSELKKIFEAPKPETTSATQFYETTMKPLSEITPEDIVAPMIEAFDTLSEETKQRIIAEAEKAFPTFSELPSNMKAAILAAIKAGTLTPENGMIFLQMLLLQLQGKLYDIQNTIINQMFKQSQAQAQVDKEQAKTEDQQRTILKEDIQRGDLKADILQETIKKGDLGKMVQKALSSFDLTKKEGIKQSDLQADILKQTITRGDFGNIVQKALSSFDHTKRAERFVENNIQFFSNLTNYYKFFINYLINPGRSLAIMWSERVQAPGTRQPPIKLV